MNRTMKQLINGIGIAAVVTATATCAPSKMNGVSPANVVPAEAPDSVPAWVRADSNFAAPSAYIPVRFRRNILVVHFRRTATQAERQAALDLVSGTVVGGHSGRTGNGFYIVRVADPGDGSRLVEASDQLDALPQVTSAGPDIEVGPQ